MKNLLIRLGLYKISQEEFLENLWIIHDEIAGMILKNKDLSVEVKNKSICEIKIFFGVIGMPILKKNMSLDFFKRISKFYFSRIVFSTIEEFDYPDDFLDLLIKDRYNFHVNGISSISENRYTNNYFQALNTLWFECPFKPINEILATNNLSFDFIGNLKSKVETNLIYIHIVPAYEKSLRKLIKMTKK